DARHLADRLAIADTITRYFTAIDGRTWDMFDDVFTEDVVAVFDGVEAPRGRQGVIDFLTGRTAHRFPLEIIDAERPMHFMGNHSATVDGDVASAETYALGHVLDRPEGKRRMRTRGLRYVDELARQSDGRWLISRREHIVDWMRLDDLL